MISKFVLCFLEVMLPRIGYMPSVIKTRRLILTLVSLECFCVPIGNFTLGVTAVADFVL